MKTSSNNSPKISFIPTCFFGDESLKHWNTRDYSEGEKYSSSTLKDYEESLNLKEGDFYRYPKCKDFSPQPTDHAICHTFNGIGVKNILKETKWTDAFTSSFKGAENNFVRKANGIELERGFTFTIGNTH